MQDGFAPIRNDLLAGLVVALALIPEAIAFSIIAGVDPKVGLYASFCIAVTTAFLGGRPAMISAATGAMALVMVTLVKEHGLQYLLAVTVLTGLLQIVAGWVRLGTLMRFVSRCVVTGFVNALAILIFMAQLPCAQKTLEKAGYAVEALQIPGDPERVIAETVQARTADLLIMGAYGHSPLRSLIFGSKTSDLLRSATLPTLLLR